MGLRQSNFPSQNQRRLRLLLSAMDDIKGHDTDVEKSELENTAALTNNSNEEFNLEKGVTRAYELKCDLSE